MTETWKRVDAYLAEKLLPADAALDAALAANAAEGLPAIDVSPLQGKFLNLLARIAGARRILEIGTLGGYSTIWLARALPEDGRLVSLEAEPRHAEIARANIARAGLADRVEVLIGPALDSLPGSRGRSTSSSSTPTSGATPTICAGRSGLRAPARSSSATT